MTSGAVLSDLVKIYLFFLRVRVSGRAPKWDFLWIRIHLLAKSWQNYQRAKLISAQKSNKHSGGPQDL